jgi:glycosyltransferase involved in cell wall biosynthesis
VSPDEPVAYSVIIPAYNEEVWLPRALTAMRVAMAGVQDRGELIVVDNNSTDRTAAIARDFGATVVFEPKNSISRARNAGAAAARGRYLIFMDADSTPSPDLLVKVIANLAPGDCCGGGALFALDDTTHRFAGRFVEMFNRVAAEHSYAPGCFMYCRRDAFEGVGGFDERLYAGTDRYLSRRLKRWGRRHGRPFRVITDSVVTTSSRKLERPGTYVFSTLVHIVFPFAVYFRALCWTWYKRPAPRR